MPNKRKRKSKNWSTRKQHLTDAKNKVSKAKSTTKPQRASTRKKRAPATLRYYCTTTAWSTAAARKARSTAASRKARSTAAARKAQQLAEARKIYYSGSTTDDASEIDHVEEHTKFDNVKEDIKFDVYELQEQWLADKQQEEVASTSTSTQLTVPANVAAPLPASILQNNSIAECEVNDENGRIERDSSVASVDKGKGEICSGDLNAVVVLPPVDEVPNSQQNTNYCFMDLQETDTEEDGYSDIDFDEEFQLIECDGKADLYNPDWSEKIPTPTPNTLKTLVSKRRFHEIFMGYSRPSTPTSYFYSLLDGTQFFHTLTECCNKKAIKTNKDTLIANNVPIKAFLAKEISIFIGMCLQMGSMQFTTLAEYWECQAYYNVDGFSNKLSYERFKSILEHLNFEDFQPKGIISDDAYAGNKFVNLWPLVYFFNKQMEMLYNCGKNLVLNEPLIYWKGRLHWMQDMKKKFRRNAVVIHLLNDHTGLILNLLMDIEGAEHKLRSKNSRELVMKNASIATELLQKKLGRGHMVFVSKYYGSYALSVKLLQHDTYSAGLLEQSRFGNSKELVLNPLRQSEQIQVRYANFIMMGKSRHRDKSLYFYTSQPQHVYKVIKFNIQHCSDLLSELDVQLKIPTEVRERIVSYQLALERNEIEWDKRLMIFVLELLLHNAFILYNMDAQNETAANKPNLITYEIFRQQTITSLLHTKFDWNSSAGGMEEDVDDISVDDGTYLEQKILEQNLQLLNLHQPKIVPPLDGKYVKKRCRMCNKSGFVSFSEVCCRICPGMPGLCESPCFKIWHDCMRKRIIAGNYK